MLTTLQIQRIQHLIDTINSPASRGHGPTILESRQAGHTAHCIGNIPVWRIRHTVTDLASQIAFDEDPKAWRRSSLIPLRVPRPDQPRILREYYGLTKQEIRELSRAELLAVPASHIIAHHTWKSNVTHALVAIAATRQPAPAPSQRIPITTDRASPQPLHRDPLFRPERVVSHADVSQPEPKLVA